MDCYTFSDKILHIVSYVKLSVQNLEERIKSLEEKINDSQQTNFVTENNTDKVQKYLPIDTNEMLEVFSQYIDISDENKVDFVCIIGLG